ncbi:hypothetical protein GCM10009605_30730 [Nocardiopsis composta]
MGRSGPPAFRGTEGRGESGGADQRACVTVENGDLAIHRATGSDADAVAGVRLRSFAAALPRVRRAHTGGEVRARLREVAVPGRETRAAAVQGAVVGMMVPDGGEPDRLYLDPPWRGRGIGDRFVRLAERRRPAGSALWSFQIDGPALRLYERHGFEAVERTDGHRNEEREPDVRYVWRPGGSAGAPQGVGLGAAPGPVERRRSRRGDRNGGPRH